VEGSKEIEIPTYFQIDTTKSARISKGQLGLE